MVKCGSEECDKEATHMIRFNKKDEWIPLCLFHTAFMESFGCDIKDLESYEKKGSI